jgi:hypothetical protein
MAILPGVRLVSAVRGSSRVAVVGTVAAVLLLALFGGLAFYALTEIRQRDATLGDVRAAQTRLDADLARLSFERDDLLRGRDEVRRERDDLAGQRDLLATARDQLTRRVADLEQRDAEQHRRVAALEAGAADLTARAAELEKSLAERERELAAARQQSAAAARTPTPAPAAATPAPVAAPSQVADVRRLVEVDDLIKAEFDVLLGHIDAVSQAFVRGSILEVNAAYQRGLQSADRLKDLFARRAPLLDRLR